MHQGFTSCRAVIINDSKILLIHRYKNGEEYWVFPGGHIEVGEAVDQALRREIQEELSMEAIEIGEQFPYNHPDGSSEIFAYCRVTDGTPQLGGPEQKIASQQDRYEPGWLDLQIALGLDNLYPIPVRDALRQKYANH